MTEDEKVLFWCVDLLRQADKIGYPCVLKTATMGYDGKGQWKFETRRDLIAHLVDIFRDNPNDADIQEFDLFYKERLPLHEALAAQ